MSAKEDFAAKLFQLMSQLRTHINADYGQWTLKPSCNGIAETRKLKGNSCA
jgi:hypothetical protein